MSELTDAINDLMREKARQEITDQMILNLRRCMEEEHVNLEAAIHMNRVLHNEEIKLGLPGVDPDDPSLARANDDLLSAFEAAADTMRGALQHAYLLVQLDQQGSPEPPPEDAYVTPWVELRKRALADLQADGRLPQ